MSDEERNNLIKEIEEIRTNIDRLQPEYEQLVAEVGSSRATLTTLRRELAKDMDALHAG